MPIQPLVFLEHTALTHVVKATRVSAGRPKEYRGLSGGEESGAGEQKRKAPGWGTLVSRTPTGLYDAQPVLPVSCISFVAPKLPTKRGKELPLWGTWTSDMNFFRPM